MVSIFVSIIKLHFWFDTATVTDLFKPLLGCLSTTWFYLLYLLKLVLTVIYQTVNKLNSRSAFSANLQMH